ncbi:hypothetical protein [Yersinia phage fHe-Yen9-04]|uniref:Uncharacterized protein n=1 Tax=Yersinia phage fHe-Yen9-04 TaxID=2052742 RepID=A0A2C9CX74_9CAUD|nr:hypothetical protein FDJ41_gp136 [Yersinia phage fHe-Yen9-04]SOK58413.1 hypothetical protein [Yersinia phage fHe-Yen9-04]VUE36182.1 hypothetical protein [Yersinia phage fHe-Yen9-04]
MSNIIFEKSYVGNTIESFDSFDILNNDDIITDIFGDAHGTFIVTVTYIPPDYDPNDE